MKKQLLSIITILTLVLTAFTPTSVFANDVSSEPDLCTDGGEHEIEEWIPVEFFELIPPTVLYPNPPGLNTTRDITVARRCKKCGKIFETAKEYEVIHHPTCQEDGYTQYTDRFGKVTTSDIIKAGPDYHSFGPIVSLGTTTETQGDIIIETERIGRMCVFCHEEEVKETKVRKITKPATCTEDGYEETIDENGNRSRTDIPSEGHKWGRSSKTETTYDESKEMTTEKTRSICETCGQLRTCTHCIWHEQPTCTEIGKWYESYNDDSEDIGGAIHMFKEEPAVGHKWSAWETSVNPTTEKEGEKVRECTVCHEKETEKIPKLKASADNNEKQQVPETTQQPAKGTTQQVVKEQGQQVAKEQVTTNVKKPATTQKKVVKVKKVKLSKKKVTIKKGKTYKIKAKVFPKNATNKKLTYKSSNKKIATVSKTGKIKAKKKGKCTITVTSKDGKKKAKLKVTVK